MKRILNLACMFSLLVFISCKQDAPKEPETPQPVYPAMSLEQQKSLFDNVDYLDFIFHDYPFSMSQSEKPSIQTNISYVGREPVFEIPATCKPIARQFYQIQGEIVIEADVYYGDPCYFYVFYENGKAVYANKMTTNGIGFFGNILNQAINAAKHARG